MNSFFGIDRLKDESDFEFLLRVCMAKHEKKIDADWQEIVEFFNLECHVDTLRKKFNGPFAMQHVIRHYEEKLVEAQVPEPIDAVKEIEKKRQQLAMDKQKVKDERTELNRRLRTEARWQAIVDIIKENVESYEYEAGDYQLTHRYAAEKVDACLMLSDWHIGAKFDTYLNSFDIDIAKARVEHTKQCTIDYCVKHKVNTLYIEVLGDMVSGIIHVSNRLDQAENIVQQTIIASELLSEFVKDLSRVVPNIKLVYCIGNHGRINADVKESISEENFEYLIKHYMTVKLENLPNVKWLDNEINHEMCFYTLANGKTIAAMHGHREKRGSYKNAVKNLTDYSETYRVDEVHIGHFHNHQIINNVIVNGSLMGCDNYAQNFKYHALPSQVLRVYDEKGNTITYEIILK